MRVLVIPEDPVLDQHILRPLAERLLEHAGRAATVTILTRPRLRGIDQCLTAETIAKVVDAYRMIDLFLVLVDRDCHENRQAKALERENEHSGRLFVCLAREEIEVWMLAPHREALASSWSEIRSECHPKERYAKPFLQKFAAKLDAGRGRAHAMRKLGTAEWRATLAVCPELAELQRRVSDCLALRS